MAVFFVTTDQDRVHSAGKVEFPFECEHETVESLLKALEAMPVIGFKLIYRRGHAHEGLAGWRVVKARIIQTLRMGEFVSIEPSLSWKFFYPGVTPDPRAALQERLQPQETT